MVTTIYEISDRYASFNDFCSMPWQCIAPMKADRRCRNFSKAFKSAQEEGDYQFAGDISHRLVNNIDASILQSFCCATHDFRLSDATECLIRLVHDYNRDAGSFMADNVTGMNLRSDMVYRTQAKGYEVFHQYNPGSTVLGQLTKPPNDKHDNRRDGYVYCLERPSNREYLKIGFTARRMTSLRIDEWRSCLPDANILHEVRVSHPWHAEQLIHLELSEYRRAAKCSVCGIYHNEWFEIKPDCACNIMNAWARLINQAALLDSVSGIVKGEWLTKVLALAPIVTSDALLKAISTSSKLPLNLDNRGLNCAEKVTVEVDRQDCVEKVAPISEEKNTYESLQTDVLQAFREFFTMIMETT